MRLGIILYLTAGVLVLGQASNSSSTDGGTPSALAPGSPAGSYALSGLDSINPYNGGLNFRLPLLRIGGRGEAGYTMTLAIDPLKWRVEHNPILTTCSGAGCQYVYTADPNWWSRIDPGYGPGVMHLRQTAGGTLACNTQQQSVPTMYNYTQSRLTFTGPGGTEFELRDVDTGGGADTPTCTNNAGKNRGRQFVTGDGSFARFESDADIIDDTGHIGTHSGVLEHSCGDGVCNLIAGNLVFRDGTVYRIYNGVVVWIKDRNGNMVTFGYDSQLRPFLVTDSLNRQTIIAYDVTNSADKWDEISYPGASGVTRKIKIFKRSLGTVLRSGYSPSNAAGLFPNLSFASTTPFNPTDVVGTVELPNGRTYQFQYNPYQELARVVLPTGGAYEYDYGSGIRTDSNSGTYGYYASGQVGKENVGTLIAGNPATVSVYRRLWEKRTYVAGSRVLREAVSRPESAAAADGASMPSLFNFGFSEVTKSGATDAEVMERSRHSYYGAPGAALGSFGPTSYSGWREGKEHKTEIFNAGGTMLREETRVFNQGDAIPGWGFGYVDEEPAQPPRNARLTFSSSKLDGTFISSRSVVFDKYNNEKQITETSAVGVAATRVTVLTYKHETDPFYEAFNKNLIGLATQKTVRAGSAIGTILADVKSYYDEGTLGSVPNIVQWDWPVNPAQRGNLTRVSQWRDLPTALWMDTKVEFDLAGNPLKRIDAKNQATVITFAPSPCSGFENTYGFATKLTNPLLHEVNVTYDCSIGKPLAITDPNGKSTTATYNDPLDRLKTIGYPDGGSKSYDYLDFANQITETEALDSCGVSSMIRNTVYDGLGRVVEGSTDDGSGTITAASAYDGLGRVVKSFVPKRSSEAAAWTETVYDFLGRPVTATSGCTTAVTSGCAAGSGQNPNATATAYSYATTSTTTIAPGNKGMRHERDGLGRLIKAIEDPFGLNLETTYTNDLLDRLTQVTQGVQNRYFSYDSLGRMLSTTQPESGLTGFVYDGNGNVTSRTDARGYVAIYGYDSLNRVFSKAYSKPAPPAGQPAYADTTTATFLWDTIFKGQLTNTVTSLGGAEVSKSENLAFDNMGRATSGKQTTAGTVSSFVYGFNKAGMLASMTYPSGRTVNNCYTSGGSPKKVTGTKGVEVTTYADAAVYASHGALASLTVGPSYQMTMGYNGHHRQLKSTEVTRTGATHFKSSLFYCAADADGCADNNGNVMRQKSHDGSVERVQDYTYDALNRLKTGSEVGGFTQTHDYDRYGNRWMTGTLPYGAAQTPTVQADYDAATNRFVVGGTRLYDLAGNMRTEGGATAGYDGEGRLTEAMFPWGTGSVTTSYLYDAEGRRVKKSNSSIGTIVYVYDAFGRLAAEYGGPAASCTTCYLFTDHLGTTRAIGDQTGAVVKRRDHMPFGEEIVVGQPWGNGRSGVYGTDTTVKPGFTGWMGNDGFEWDVDYAGARYFRRGVGRFVSADPLLASGRAEGPQTWNRYAYVLGNPLRFVDPTGLVWISSDDAQNPYRWRDECGENEMCYNSVAAVVGGNLRVYGSAGDFDVFDVQGKDVSTAYGSGRIVDISFMFSNPDAYIQDNQRVKENFLNVNGAAALFNTGSYYHSLYPKDEKLGFNGGSLGNGLGAAIHERSHALGQSLDLAYMGSDGKMLSGNGASAAADPGRMGNITAGLISTPNTPFRGFLTSTPDRFGGSAGRAQYFEKHGNHAHFQKRIRF